MTVEEEEEEHHHLPMLVVSFLKTLRYSSEDMMSSLLDSVVKHCSSEVFVSSRATW